MKYRRSMQAHRKCGISVAQNLNLNIKTPDTLEMMKRAAQWYRRLRLALVLAVIALCGAPGIAGAYHGFSCDPCFDEHTTFEQQEFQQTSQLHCCPDAHSQNSCRDCCASQKPKPLTPSRTFSSYHSVSHLPVTSQISAPPQIALLLTSPAEPISLSQAVRFRCPSRAPPLCG